MANSLLKGKGEIKSVVFVSHSAGLGGSERSLLEILRGLTMQGVLCHVLLPAEGPLSERIVDVGGTYSIIDYRWWTIFPGERREDVVEKILGQFLDFVRCVSQLNPDVIYTNTSVVNIGAMAARHLNVPHIWHIREYGEEDHKLDFVLNKQDRMEYISRYSDFVIFNSRSVQRSCLNYTCFRNNSVVYNSVTVANDGQTDVSGGVYGEDLFRLIIIGSVQRGKGQKDAVSAVAELKRVGIHVELLIVGNSDPIYLQEINEIIASEKIEKQIQFLGYVDNPFSLIKRADLLLMCSENEAFGRVTIEGMLAQKPVIGTRRGGTIEIISEGETGFLYEPGDIVQLKDKIKYVIQNPAEADRIAKNGYDFAKNNFSVRLNALRLLKIITAVCEERQRNVFYLERFPLSDQETRLSLQERIIQNQAIEIYKKEEIISEKDREISALKLSKFWKIRGIYLQLKRFFAYPHELYKKKVKKFIPRTLLVGLNRWASLTREIFSDPLLYSREDYLGWKRYFEFIAKQDQKLIFFIDRKIPSYDRDAGSFIVYQYLLVLRQLGYNVIFWPKDLTLTEPYSKDLRDHGIFTASKGSSLRLFFERFGGKVDVVFLSRPEIATEALSLVRAYSNAKIVYMGHDLHYLREERKESVWIDKKYHNKSLQLKQIEFSVMSEADISLFFSDEEIKIIHLEDVSIRAKTIPWIQGVAKVEAKQMLKDKVYITFLGGFLHAPNTDAVKWFYSEIYPLIKKDIPNCQIVIVGSNIPQEIFDLSEGQFQIKGFMTDEDLSVLFAKTKVFVAPLRFGAGFKGKIAKAMSFGIPVVTSSIGAEGMNLEDGETAMIANEPQLFAKKVVELYSDEVLWKHISRNGIVHVQTKYSIGHAKETIKDLLIRLMGV